MVLDPEELIRLLKALVVLDFGLGLRRGELQGLQWGDFDFENAILRVKRSVFKQVVGLPKTEASRKDLPLSVEIAAVLQAWQQETPYKAADDWVFASLVKKGKQPYWIGTIMQHHIQPVARTLGIKKDIAWGTFRRTCATLLKNNGEDPKVVQELLRHASFQITMNIYTQAVTQTKRKAHRKLMDLVFKPAEKEPREQEGTGTQD